MRNGLNPPAWPKPMDSLPPPTVQSSGGWTGLADTPARRRPAPNSPPVFLVCGYNNRPDISEGLASVYLKFKQLKVRVP